MSKKKSHYGKAGLVFEELEPRLLLSADPLAVATEASVAIVEELVLGDNEDQTMIVQSSIEQSFTSIRNELVIIDSRAPNYQQLHNDLIKAQQQGRNIHVVVLDAHRDGIEQINEALTSHNKLDAVHIVSHGDDGQLQLGATQLNKATLRERSGDIAQWRQTFTEGGDLLIYGCDLASTADGRLLVNALGYLTATDVAASDDLTGNKLLGGDWDLEYEAGDIETSVAFSDDVQQQWQGTLEGAAPAGAEQQQAAAEEQQQQQEQQAQLDAQQAALNEEQQKAAEQNTDEQQAVVKEEQRQEVVFIDESVTDFQVFIDDLQGKSDGTTTFEIYTLDGRSDGVEYIEAVLAEYDGVDAVHIYSHGDDASVKLGSTWLNPNNIEAYNYSLASWSNGLDADADILIYGCNLAATTNGEQFVTELAQLTGADVAASDDITGHASLGGDWELEYASGIVETSVALDTEAQSEYQGILNTFIVSNTNATGAGSLYQAILDANANAGVTDTITFNIAGAGPHVINLTSALPTITDTVIIDGTTEPDYAGDPVVRIDGTSAGAGANGLTFAAASDASIVRGLMITNFSGYGIQVNAGADRIRIVNNWIGTTGTGSTGVGNTNTGINIQGANTFVGGSGANDGNVITNNGNEGINITGAGATGTVIQGNIIGLDPDGSTGSGNTDVGIAVLSGADNTTIGGAVAAERNVISNNFEGIEINSNNNVVQGNYIGTDAGGTLDRGNRSDDGIEIQSNATGNLIGGTEPGAGNLIAFNARDGVYLVNGTGNTVLGNRIHSNTELGIDLGTNGVNANDVNDVDTGANDLQNYPVLSSVLTNGINTIAIDGSLNSTASTNFRIEFFASAVADASGNGEAESYLGFVNVSTDAGGNAIFSVNLTEVVANGEFVTATATVDNGGGSYGSTSEFAQNVSATLSNFAPTLHDWYDANWDYRKDISIDYTKVDANLEDFPVLITLNTDADLAAFAQADGDDILFTSADGTKLAHEIESYDSVTGALTVWVKTDLSAVADTTLFLYYGNAAAANQQDAANVWDASYMGVWHLNDTPTGAAGDINDSTANNNDGTSEGAMDAADSVTAKIGTGLDFDEVDDVLRMSDSATLDSVNDEATIELWAWFDDTADGDTQIILSSSNRYSAIDGYEWAQQNDGDHFFYPDAMTPDGNYNLGPNPLTNQQWHHLAVTMDYASSDVDVYIDGVAMTFTTEGVPANWTTLTSSDDWMWGGNPDRASRYFDGMMDEIRVSDVVRSQEWIQASINNQSDPSTFFTLGVAESRDLTLTDINEDDTNPPGDTVLAILNSGAGDRITDVDAGALEGIAVVSVDDSNGQWQYDATGGGTWVAFGAVSDASAVLLDTSAKLRFVPSANYNGPSGNLTFRAWDQTTGTNGSTADLTAYTLRDEFTTASFTNNDGTASWTSGWIETDGAGAGVGTGNIQITAGELSIRGVGNSIAREADLSNTSSATLSFDFSTGSGVEASDPDSVVIEISDNGGSSWTTLETFDSFDGVNTGSRSYDITAYATTSTQIRFNVANGYGGPNEYFYLDNVQIEYTNAGVTGGNSAFSSAKETVSVIVNPVNDAPGATDDPLAFDTYLTSLGPTGHWRFGEAGGGIAVDQAGLNDGSYNGPTLGQAGAISVDANTALQFDGIDDYAEIPHDPAYLLDNGTVQLWFNTSDVTQRADLFSKDALGNVTGGHLSIYLDGTGNIETRLQSASASYLANSTLSLVNNQWHHVAFTFGADGMQLYVDGQLQDSNAYTGGLGTTSGGAGNFEPIAIGASTQVSGTGAVTPLQDYFTGYMDEVALFGTALSADQIQNLYSGGLQNYTITEDNPLNVSAANGVLINDYDLDGDAITAVLVSGPSNAASFTLNPDGSFDYTPLANFSGTDTFTYMANDGSTDSNVATVTITVTGDNDAPVNTVPGTQVVLEDTQTAIAGISVADPDAGAGVITTQLTVTNGVLDITLSGAATISAGANSSNTLTISGNVTDINATLASLQYTGNSNVNGVAADTLTVVTNDLGNTGTGGAQSDTDNVQINITPVNDAPLATNLSAPETYTEDTVLNLTDIVVSDVDSANVTVTLTLSDITAGSLTTGTSGAVTSTFVGGVWTASGAIADVNTLLAGVTFTPTLNYNSNFTIATSVSDSVAPAITGSKAMTGTAVNDAPQATNLSAAETYTEDAALNLTDIVVSDVDSANVTVTLTLSDITAGSLNTATSGAVTSTFVGGVWTASGAVADVNTLLAGLTFTPALNYNSNFNIATSVSDGVAPAITGSKAMNGTAVNDAPQATNLSAAETYTEDTALNLTDIVVSDVDSANVTVTLTLSDVTAGSLNTGTSGAVTSTFVGGVWTASGAIADVNTLLAGLTFTPTLNYNSNFTIATSVSDGVAPALTGSKAMTGTAVNDVPVANANTVTTAEDNAYTFSVADFTFSDVESDSLVAARITNISLGGGALTHSGGTPVLSGDTLTAAQLNTLVYTPPASVNGLPLATFDFTVNDANAGVMTAQMSINVTAVNTAPTATNLSAAETYTEDTALNLTDIVVSDVDSANVTVTLTLSDVTAGSLNTGTSGTVTSTFAGGVWTASGAIADVNTLLAGLTFTPTLNYNSNFTIATSVSDGVAPAITGSKAMTGTPVNDVPQATNLSAAETYTEDTALNLTDIVVSDVDSANVTVTLTLSDVTAGSLNTGTSGTVTSTFAGGVWTANGAITDVNTLLAGLTFTPSLNYNSNFNIATSVSDGVAPAVTGSKAMTGTAVNDVPVANANTVTTAEDNAYTFSVADFTYSDVEGDSLVAARITNISLGGGTLTHSGGIAVANGNTLTAAQLNTLVYTPPASTNGLPLATFDFTVNDASAGVMIAQMSINVTAVNTAPTATNLSAAETYTEDTALNLTDIVVSDVDSANVTVTLTLSDVTAGSLSTGTSGAVTSTFVGGVWTASGAIADVNTLLAGLTFTPTLDYNSNFTIATSVSDGVAPALTGSKAMTGTAVNDAPTMLFPSTVQTTNENTPLVFSTANGNQIAVGDIDANGNDLLINFLSLNGTLTLNGTVGLTFVTGDGVADTAMEFTGSIADINAALEGLIFTPDADFNGGTNFQMWVDDQGNTGSGGPEQTNRAALISVTPVNDPPTATNLSAAETYTEDTALNLTDIVVSDVDSANVTVTLTLSDVTAGSLNTGTSGAVTSTFVGGVWTASGAIADVNTLLAGLTFTPALDYNSNFTIATSVSDGVAPAISGSKVMTGTAVNDVPVATANTVSTTEDSAFNFASTDFIFTDVEGNSLVSATITGLNLASGTLTHSGGTAVTNGMTLTAAELDTLIYTPATNANGTPLASFNFTVNDAGAGAVSAQMSINVTAQPDAAVIAGVDTGVVTEDVDPDLDNLLEVSGSLTILDPDAGEALFNVGVFGGTYGVITLNAAGDWDYAANTNQAAIQNLAAGASLTDTITILSVDGTTHDINITIMGTNDAPVAGNDVVAVNEGSFVIIDVAATDSDIDNAIDLNSIIITGLPVNGAVVVNGDGTITYTHNGSETLLDSFTYTISDISGAISNSATVTVTVNPVNDPPVAGDDTTTVVEGNAVLIDLAANDSDADNALDLNSISIIGAPANGLLAINGDGTVTYTHDGSNTVSDLFTYTISDISGAISNTATVNITVTPVNNAPTTSGISNVTVNEDSANATIDLNAAFDDSDNLDSELAYSIVGNTNIGLFSVTGIDGTTGQLTLDYAANMNGSAQISVRATDPSGLSVDTLFTVTVTPVNDAPVMQANAGMLATGTAPGTITNSELNVTDIDNVSSEIAYMVTALPANGTLLLNGVAMAMNDTFTQADLDNNLLVYQSAGTAVSDQFGFAVADGSGGTLSNNTFDIIVQLGDDDGDTDTGITDTESDPEEEETEEEATEDSGGASDGAGGYGGGYVPFGGTTAPQKPSPALSIDPTPVKKQAQAVEEKDPVVAEVKDTRVTTFSGVQVKSMEALWSAIDQMKQEMGNSAEDKMSSVEIKAAAAKSSGVVLTAGVVAWILRSGALLSSLMSTIPLWKGYDPLPILAYKDDEEKEDEIHEDKIPTSLEELKKLKKVKEKKANEVDVDSIFGGSAIRE